jgi:hypothetical protein
MGSNPIILTDGNHGLKFGLTSVGVDGPYLYGFNAGALGTTDGGDDVSLAWSQTEVNIYKPLDMNGNNISSDSNTVFSIGTNISTNNNITFSNYAGALGDIKLKSYNIEIGDNQNGTVSIASGGGGYITTVAQSTINTVAETYFTGGITRFLISTPIPQPILQYGQVSSTGSSGSVVVTIPQRYTSVSSYLPFAVMADYPASEIYVSTLTRATFEIGWQNGGGGNQLFNWHTMGT